MLTQHVTVASISKTEAGTRGAPASVLLFELYNYWILSTIQTIIKDPCIRVSKSLIFSIIGRAICGE